MISSAAWRRASASSDNSGGNSIVGGTLRTSPSTGTQPITRNWWKPRPMVASSMHSRAVTPSPMMISRFSSMLDCADVNTSKRASSTAAPPTTNTMLPRRTNCVPGSRFASMLKSTKPSANDGRMRRKVFLISSRGWLCWYMPKVPMLNTSTSANASAGRYRPSGATCAPCSHSGALTTAAVNRTNSSSMSSMKAIFET